MTTLRFDTLTMPAADLGPENPLPPLQPPPVTNAGFEIDPQTPAEARAELESGWHIGSQVLPYRMQDGYDRNRQPRAFRTAVLENDTLRATFLLQLGGRLWSLVHKPSGEELLYVNPVFQPANLARRNAWFSGGVEWNGSVPGHSPLTCEPLFVATLHDAQRGPVLRQYEWDRVRGAMFQVDAYLPADSPLLLVRVRLRNPWDETIPTYWWSNIAVPEHPEHRVIVPADHAFQFGYGRALRWASVPENNGVDASYPARIGGASDYFYYIPANERRWIASVNGHGAGLVQVSTDRLRGRKLFVWGQSSGGRRWQEFLSPPGGPYIELQAGLALTQRTSVPMEANAQWDWLEGYGRVSGDPRVLHGDDWHAAIREVAQQLDAQRSAPWFDEELAATGDMAGRAPDEIAQHGSGWGALEQRRRDRMHEPSLTTPATPLPEQSLGPAQQPWLTLLETGTFPEHPPSEPPASWMTQRAWRDRLKAAVGDGDRASDHWASWLQLGVMAFAHGDRQAAEQAWRRSVATTPNAWAYRNLAVLARGDERGAEVVSWYRQALQLAPDQPRLAIETLQAMIAANDAAGVEDLLSELPPNIAQHSRVRQLRLQAALAIGDVDAAGQRLDEVLAHEPVDVREGEVSLADLWFDYHQQRLAAERGQVVDNALRAEVRRRYPPPAMIDFRMRVEEPTDKSAHAAQL